MQRTSRLLSHVNSHGAGEDDATLPVVLEFLSPSAGIAATPIPRVARRMIWIVGSMFAAWLAALGWIRIDRVITAPGRVVSQAATIVMQPLETAIVRSIDVREGQMVRAGDSDCECGSAERSRRGGLARGLWRGGGSRTRALEPAVRGAPGAPGRKDCAIPRARGSG